VAKKKHIARLNRCVDAWNEWRRAKGVMQPDLSYANLEGARHANLRDPARVHAQGEQRRSYFSTFSGTFPVDKLSIKWHDDRRIAPAPF
jgi:hypothetical protein